MFKNDPFESVSPETNAGGDGRADSGPRKDYARVHHVTDDYSDSPCLGGSARQRRDLQADMAMPNGVHSPSDMALAWRLVSNLRSTSRKQAAHLVQAYRQAQLDAYRGQQTLHIGQETFRAAAEQVKRNHSTAMAFSGYPPEVFEAIMAAAEDLNQTMLSIPRAVMALYLRRYDMG